jgi:hypothetical protein
MAKYAGLVGYVTQEETVPGVWSASEKAVMMKGDVISSSSSVQNDDKVNSDITLNHRVSLIGDSYAFDNYYNLKWITFGGRKLEVTSVEMHRPRLIVTVGGLYNAQ